MIISKCVDVKASNDSDAMGEYFLVALSDAMATLKIDNLPVMQIRTNMCNLTLSEIRWFTGGGSTSKSGTHVSFYQFINGFASLDCGILHNDQFATIGRYADEKLANNSFELIQLDNAAYCPAYIWPSSDSTPQNVRRVPYYLYNGADVAYIGFGHPSQGIVFAKLKSIDDDTVYKYVVIFIGETGYDASDYAYLGRCQAIKVLSDASLMTDSYTAYTNRKLDNINKAVIEKFIHNGYYSNELFWFDGLCPSGLFNINNNTYYI